MAKPAIVLLLFVAILTGVVTVYVARHFRAAEISTVELAQKPPAPPESPDIRCFKAQRVLEESETKPAARLNLSLTSDEAAIYTVLLERWNARSRTPLNVSLRTTPLYRSIDYCECLREIDTESLGRATHSFRILPRSLASQTIRLVDPDIQSEIVQTSDPENSIRNGDSIDTAVDEAFANGLFEVSEIAFDKTGQKALVSYSFVCGRLCGNGGVWRFEKVNGEWRKSQQVCGGWMS